MQPIKAVGIEVIADSVAAPALASPGVRAVALCEGPAHPQVSGISCQKWNHLIHHHFKVPFAILCGTLCSAHEDVGADAAGKTREVDGGEVERTARLVGWRGRETDREKERHTERQRYRDRE